MEGWEDVSLPTPAPSWPNGNPTHCCDSAPPSPVCLSCSKAVYQGEGWLGIGFSDSGRMPGSDAVVGLPTDDSVMEYDMDDYSTPDEALLQARGIERVGRM